MTTIRNTIRLFITIGVFALILGILPFHAYAAEVYFKVVPNEVPGDEAVIIEAYIDPQQTKINTVEGVVRLESTGIATLSTVVIETGGSVLELWPISPTYDESENIIRFTGGTPDGFERAGLLFRMRIFASQPGNVVISWVGTTAYLNDGKGTKEHLSSKSLFLSLTKGAPDLINPSSKDSTPPSFTYIEIGRDPSVYDGKYFISFHATDDISGVSRYEVREGGEVVEAPDSVYVFKDQTRQTRVDITAYDNAGNSKSIQVPQRHKWTINDILLISIAVLFIMFIGWHVYRKRKYISI